MFLLQNEVIWYISMVPVVLIFLGVGLASPNNLGYNQKLMDTMITYLQYSIIAIATDYLVLYFSGNAYFVAPIVQLVFASIGLNALIKAKLHKEELKDE